jgi:phage shock protein PspC (stress-responsive transcriptional regulator)
MVAGARLEDAAAMTTETTETTPSAPEPERPRRLERSSEDRVIAGVCGGLGRYLGIDPVVCRLIFIVLIFFGGAGIIAYGAAWLLVPSDKSPDTPDGSRSRARRVLTVLAVIVITVLFAFGGAWAAALGGAKAVAIVVIVGGAVLALGGLLGGVRWLIAPVLAVALAAGLVSAADVDARGGVGERIYRPDSMAQLRPGYKLGVGHMVVDLRFTHLTPGDHLIKLRLAVGQIEVYVPQDACVTTRAHVGMGDTEVFDHTNGGIGIDALDVHTAPARVPHVILDAKVKVGSVRIEPTEDGTYAGNERCSG